MNTALLVIDVQTGLFDAQPRPWKADEVIANINRLIDRARSLDMPVIFLQAEYTGIVPRGSDAWRLHDALRRRDDDRVMEKTRANAFLGTDLDRCLRELAIGEVIVCGYATEFCVDSTCRYASALGYTIQLATDAHTTHDKAHLSARRIIEHHNITLCMAPNVSAINVESGLFPAASP